MMRANGCQLIGTCNDTLRLSHTIPALRHANLQGRLWFKLNALLPDAISLPDGQLQTIGVHIKRNALFKVISIPHVCQICR